MQEARPPSPGRLWRHDRLILGNEVRRALWRWSDRFIALAAIGILAVGANVALADRPARVIAAVLSATAASIGLGAARLYGRRIAFHDSDGICAQDSLQPASRLRYARKLHSVAGSGAILLAVIVRADMALLALPGYAVGALVGHGWNRIVFRPGAATVYAPRVGAMRSLLRKPWAGAVMAALTLPLLLATNSLKAPAQPVLTAIIAGAALLPLTAVDDALVRFLALSGYGPWATLRLLCRAGALYLVLLAPFCFVLMPLPAALAGAIVILAGLALMALRILSYRLYPRRMAETAVTLHLLALGLLTLALPVALPLIVAAMGYRLYRRASAQSWLLA